MVNDVDLLHLYDISYRFESLTKIAFVERYASKYFVFDDDTQSQRETYEVLFDRFGCYADVNAIEARGMRIIDENHWLPQLLRQYTNQLQKLSYYDCWFEEIEDFLSQHMNVEHLTIESVGSYRQRYYATKLSQFEEIKIEKLW